MAGRPRAIRLTEMIGCTIVTSDGRRVGRVADVCLTASPPYRVTALEVGAAGWFERLGIERGFRIGRKLERRPHRVPWEAVAEFDGRNVTLKPGRDGDVRPGEP